MSARYSAGPVVSITQAGQQVAGERVIEHGERRASGASYVRFGGRFACHAGVVVGHHGRDMQRFFGYWFTYFGPDPG